MFWLKLIIIFVAGLSGVIATIRDLKKDESNQKGKKFTIALLMFAIFGTIGAFSLEISGHFIELESNQQRTADLHYIQTLSAPLVRLGFDITLNGKPDPDTIYDCMIFFHKDFTNPSWGRISTRVWANYNPKNNWTIKSDIIDSLLPSEFKAGDNHIRFWIYDFGIYWRHQMMWKPDRVSDLAGIMVQVLCSPEFIEKNRYYKFPVTEVELYINSFESKNLLLKCDYRSQDSPYTLSFFPSNLPLLSDTNATLTDSVENFNGFYLDLYNLRESIYKSLK